MGFRASHQYRGAAVWTSMSLLRHEVALCHTALTAVALLPYGRRPPREYPMKLTMLLSLASLILAVFTLHAWATADDRFNGQLLKLDPITRLEQTCDFEVMDKINREH